MLKWKCKKRWCAKGGGNESKRWAETVEEKKWNKSTDKSCWCVKREGRGNLKAKTAGIDQRELKKKDDENDDLIRKEFLKTREGQIMLLWNKSEDESKRNENKWYMREKTIEEMGKQFDIKKREIWN